MKNVKRISMALALIVVIAVGVIFGVMASDDEYTGDIARFETLVQAAIDAEDIDSKEAALVEAEAYIAEKPIDPATAGYDEIMELYLVALLDGVDTYITAVSETTNDNNKVNYAQRADCWFGVAFDTDEAKTDDRYATYLAKVHASNIALGNVLCDKVDKTAMAKVDTDVTTVEADGAYKFAKTFYDKGTFDQTAEDYTALSTKVAELNVLYTTSKEARYQDLLAQSKMTDYDVKTPVYTNNFQGSTGNPTLSNYNGYDKNGLALKNTGSRVDEELPDGTTNTYYEVNINGAMNEAGTSYLSTFITLNFSGTNDKFVMELDFTSMTTLPSSNVYFQSRPSAGTNTWMAIKPNGDIVDHNGNLIVSKAVVPGEWTHITIICEMETINQSKLYVDYAFAGYLMGDHKGYGYTPENMRIGNSAYKSGQMCFDNIYISHRGSICDLNYLDRMEDIDEFIYLVNYMQRTGEDEVFITIPDCIIAYNKAAELAGNYYGVADDGSIEYRESVTSIEDPVKQAAAKAAVDQFVAYNPTDITLSFKKANLAKYDEYVKALTAIAKAPTSSSISARNKQVEKIQTFIAANGTYIFLAGDDNAEITGGSGTAADPYILPNGAHGFTCTEAQAAGWIYYAYTAMDAGTVKLSTSSSDIVLGSGTSAAGVVASDDKSIMLELEEGETVWFAIKSASGAAIAESVGFSVSFDLGYNYDDILAIFSAEVERIEQDQVISKFISYMTAFQNASSVTLLQSRYDAATKLIEDGMNTTLVDVEGYEDFKKAFEQTYARGLERIAEAKQTQNSKDIVAAINYLLSTYPDEADWKLTYIEEPTTDEEIASNERYTFISNYVVLIRSKLAGDNYDPEYITPDGTGIELVIQKFAAVNDHYYGILQGEHEAHLSEQFASFEATNSYIEKKGLISYIQRYLNSEDVEFTVVFTCENEDCIYADVEYNGSVKDVARPTCPVCDTAVKNYRLASEHAGIAELLRKYVAYEAELAPQEGNYDALLSQNTVYFLNAVKKFDTAITYVDKLVLLNEAMPFYYAMNIDGEEVVEAIAKYDALAAELAVVQKASRDFIDYVLLLPAVKDEEGIDGYYACLVSAAALRDKVDNSIEGVTDAIASYEAAKAEYEAVTNVVNNEIKESANVIGVVGANCGFTSVLSVVMSKLFDF